MYDKINMPGYDYIALEREGGAKLGGGLMTFYKSILRVHGWSNPDEGKYEEVRKVRLWLILDSKAVKLQWEMCTWRPVLRAMSAS